MNTQEFIKAIIKRIANCKFIILAGGLVVAVLMYMYAHQQPAIYTATAKLFPLSSPSQDNSSSKLSELIGGTGTSKSLSDEANVNIEEVAKSRKTRDAVVGVRLPDFKNKMVAEILISQYNKHRSYFSSAIELPKSDSDIISIGSDLISNNYNVKFNKNNLLEVSFSGNDKEILLPVTYTLIDKISQFYKDLKVQKAKADYDFIQAKMDSFENVIKGYDKERVRLNNTTLFVPVDRLQYQLPKENLDNDKIRVLGQRNGAAVNREEALWRLQKVTPIIQTLDSPRITPGFVKPSGTMYGAVGFVIGCLLFAILFIIPLIYKYVNQQIETALSLKESTDNNVTTTA